MDVNFDSTSGLPNTYDYINNLGSNPTILLIITCIILVYYFIFSSLGINANATNSQNSGGGLAFIEALMWAMFILLILLNGSRYFFGINVTASIKKLLSNEPEVDIIIHNPPSEDNGDGNGDGNGNGNGDGNGNGNGNSPPELIVKNQTYHIPGNVYTYDDAKALCKAYGARLASYKELEDSYTEGAEWCSYGWSAGQLALFPTQLSTWNKLKKHKGSENNCGRPGINGGYIANPNVQFGANCYGFKPKIRPNEAKAMRNETLIPPNQDELAFNNKVANMRNSISNILVSPFNSSKWSSA